MSPKVGDWYRIKKNRDNGGRPLIRIERVTKTGKVIVTDWFDFNRQSFYPKNKTGKRRFADNLYHWASLIKSWNNVTLKAES